MDQPDKIVDFEMPPVSEVAFGVQFEPLTELMVPHVGLLWAEFSETYPQADEHPPLAPVREDLSEPGKVDVQLDQRATLPRIWLANEAGTELLQLQRERFHLNWQRRSADDDYPGFKTLWGRFLDAWGRFAAFCDEWEIQPPRLAQAELTYVNPIALDDVGVTLADLGQVVPDLTWRATDRTDRFLPDFEAMRWQTSFLLPDGAGRLWVGMMTRRNEPDRDEVRLELTVRGEPPQDLEAWFRQAREWIVRGFADVTSRAVQDRVWRRTL